MKFSRRVLTLATVLMAITACSSVKPPELGTCDGSHKKPINGVRDEVSDVAVKKSGATSIQGNQQ